MAATTHSLPCPPQGENVGQPVPVLQPMLVAATPPELPAWQTEIPVKRALVCDGDHHSLSVLATRMRMCIQAMQRVGLDQGLQKLLGHPHAPPAPAATNQGHSPAGVAGFGFGVSGGAGAGAGGGAGAGAGLGIPEEFSSGSLELEFEIDPEEFDAIVNGGA